MQRLNKRLTLQRQTAAAIGGGAASRTWEDVATLWASLRPLSGREYLEMAAARSAVSARIRTRAPVVDALGARVRPSSRMRFKYQDGDAERLYYVEHVIEEYERGQFYVCLCNEPEEVAA